MVPRAALLALGASVVGGLKVVDDRKSCTCFNWADAYSEEGVVCGQGLEMMHVYGDYNDTLHPYQFHFAKYMSSYMMHNYIQYCDNFFKRAHFNHCVNQRMMNRDNETTGRGSWCYVSGDCKGPNVFPLPEEGAPAVKICKEGEDKILSSTPVHEVVQLGVKDELDQHLLAQYSSVYEEVVAAKVMEGNLTRYKDAGKKLYLWSPKDHLGTRLVVKGNTVWRHEVNANVSSWESTCIQGCDTCGDECESYIIRPDEWHPFLRQSA